MSGMSVPRLEHCNRVRVCVISRVEPIVDMLYDEIVTRLSQFGKVVYRDAYDMVMQFVSPVNLMSQIDKATEYYPRIVVTKCNSRQLMIYLIIRLFGKATGVVPIMKVVCEE